MKQRTVLPALAFLFLFFFVHAFSLETNQSVFLKGETIVASGACTETVSIEGTQQEKRVFSAVAGCENGSYSIQQPVSFLFPSGELFVSATERAVSETKKIEVKPTRESAFLAVSIESPGETTLPRAAKTTIRVSVLDAGKPVENAVVQSWGINGEQIVLSPVVPGIYAADTMVPFDAELKNWNLFITTEAGAGNETYGGEQSVSIPVVPASISLELISPSGQNLSALQENLFRVKATYPDGSPLNNPVVLLQRNDQTIVLEEKQPGFFETKQVFSGQEIGLQKMVLIAGDSAGNKTSQSISFFVTSDFQSQFVSILPYLLSIVVLVALVALVLVPVIRKQKGEKGMVRRKHEIEQELSVLQKQYFDENSLSKDSYRQKSVSLEQELEEINKKLNTTKK
jgi:hypothetical protein